ncbi:hypothetical protein M569_07668, partial [Genlisea aurea]
ECNDSREQSDASEVSSYSSSNISNNVLDRYIDGEQQQAGKCNARTSSCLKTHFENGNHAEGKRPPRFQFNGGHVSHDTRRLKPKSQPPPPPPLFHDGAGTEHRVGSPMKLAHHVVERLSQSQFYHPRKSEEFQSHSPITIQDIYKNGSRQQQYNNDVASSPRSEAAVDYWHRGGINDASDDHGEFSSQLLENQSFAGDKDGGESAGITADDLELYKKFRYAEERAADLADELQSIQFKGMSVPALIQTIRNEKDEKLKMAYEVSRMLEDRIAERASFREKLKLGMAELKVQCRRLEKEKDESQLALEKELDRRSNEWSTKLEKFQVEEQRLRERVRELAEQNVVLQREVSSSTETDTNARAKISNLEKQLSDSSFQLQEAMEKNSFLHRSLSEMQSKAKAAEEDRDCIRRNYDDKVSECKDMHRAVTRLQRTCNDQEKTIEGLRGLCEEDLGKKVSKEHLDLGFAKFHMEHVRLTGIEHSLRKEVESYRAETDSLRRENIDLLTRLKSSRKEGGEATATLFKLDRELQNRVNYFQNQLLSLLRESNQLGRKLFGHVKSKRSSESELLVECEVKLQGVERAAENLTSSLDTISGILHDKSTENPPEVRSMATCFELKAEILLSRLLHEKLYSKELETEQLRAELAASVRCNDILKSEMQNAEDDLSCIGHKMKELDLQVLKKEEAMSKLESEFQECRKELGILRGIIPKVSEERDMVWEEVKQAREKNMLLSSENDSLKKKIEALDEDILVKDGQINILKDSVSKPFDFFAGPD